MSAIDYLHGQSCESTLKDNVGRRRFFFLLLLLILFCRVYIFCYAHAYIIMCHVRVHAFNNKNSLFRKCHLLVFYVKKNDVFLLLRRIIKCSY